MELPIQEQSYRDDLIEAGSVLMSACHDQALVMGWHEDADAIAALPIDERLKAKALMWYQATKLMLSVTELAEGMEGLRKDIPDTHLPQYPMMAVELADCVIRCCDQAGHMGFPLGEIIAAKLLYNATRNDHQREVRDAEGGKAV